MRTITAHLLEYTLAHHFDANRSRCAKALDIRRTDFNKIFNRCVNGTGSSLTMIEALLKLYHEAGYSLDEAMISYAVSEGDGDIPSVTRHECDKRPQIFREQLSDEYKAADCRVQVLKSAEQMLINLERAFCMGECSMESCVDDCPCMKFCDFVDWMKTRLDNDVQKRA